MSLTSRPRPHRTSAPSSVLNARWRKEKATVADPPSPADGPDTTTGALHGFEKTFQVNHLAPFLLTHLLLDKLRANNAKVIQTASNAPNTFGTDDFTVEDLNNEREYAPQKAYGHAKLENVLFTQELDRRHRHDGIAAVAFHPGVVRSSFASDTTHYMRFIYHPPLKYLITISPEKSAQSLVRLIEGRPGTDWQPGGFYDKTKPAELKFKDDGTVARNLWQRSEQLAGIAA
jgi:NAD(P)-dependent dehydrogenase (short-subunit alcohol dehydrogenase family)